MARTYEWTSPDGDEITAQYEDGRVRLIVRVQRGVLRRSYDPATGWDDETGEVLAEVVDVPMGVIANIIHHGQPPSTTAQDVHLPLRCIRCGCDLAAVFPDDSPLQPSGGTMFTSGGNYGSTVWDPSVSSRDRLHINVCDRCLTLAAQEGVVARVTTLPVQPETRVRQFDPDEERKAYEAAADALNEQVDERRADPAFMDRIRQTQRQMRPALERLAREDDQTS